MMWHVRSTWWLETKSYARIVPPPLRRASADTREKCSLLFGFAHDQFLLKRKGYFSLVFCPPSIRAGGGTNVDLVLRKLFLGKGFGKTSADFCFCILSARRRGLGRNPRGLLCFFGGLPVDETLVVFFVLICYHLNIYANERHPEN